MASTNKPFTVLPGDSVTVRFAQSQGPYNTATITISEGNEAYIYLGNQTNIPDYIVPYGTTVINDQELAGRSEDVVISNPSNLVTLKGRIRIGT